MNRTTLTIVALLAGLAGTTWAATPAVRPQPAPADSDAFLDELGRRSFLFFWETANPANGLVPDRAHADGSGKGHAASVAATGFGLTALCIGDARGWVDSDLARQRVQRTLEFFLNDAENVHGYFYHFLNLETGKRDGTCELSSIDTALLMAGVLTVGQYYKGTEVEQLAEKLYRQVDWPWMLNGGDTLSMGWSPENGFLDARWGWYSEHMILELLGMGSPTHPLDPAIWKAWHREPVITYGGKTFAQFPPLFIHQFSHAWVDYRNKRDDVADYWKNSVLATQAHQQFCMDIAHRFPQFGRRVWGISSSDGPNGYEAWGGPPEQPAHPIDGTIVPYAVAGSVPFLPEECIATLQYLRRRYGKLCWSRYGFRDAFNPHTGWAGRDVLGIDVGITLVMIENYRSGMVWDLFMANPSIQRAMKLAGFRTLTDEDKTQPNCSIFGLTDLPRDLRHPAARKAIAVKHKEQSLQWQSLEAGKSAMRFAFSWDEQALRFRASVRDASAANDQPAETLYKGDCVELYLDPAGDGLRFGDKTDIQIVFGVENRCVEFFAGREVSATVTPTDSGYDIEADLPWDVLGVTPKERAKLSMSVSLHDAGHAKSDWDFRPRGEVIDLGELELE